MGRQGVKRRLGGEDRCDGRAPRDMPWAEEEGVPTGVDLELVALAEDVRDVVLRLGRLTLGPGVVGRLLAGELARTGVTEAPDDRRATVLDVRAGRALRELDKEAAFVSSVERRPGRTREHESDARSRGDRGPALASSCQSRGPYSARRARRRRRRA